MARALFHMSPVSSCIRSIELPATSKDQLRLKSLYSLISTGTETLVARGEVPQALYNDMRVPFQEGDFSFPIKYGYSLVAQVEGPGELAGQTVHLLHPHQDECVVTIDRLYPIPESIPARRATLASNLETVVNAIWDSGISIGDRAVIVGFGMIGSLLARVLSMLPHTELEIREIDRQRITVATNMGFRTNTAINGTFDLAFHTSASAEGLQYCIDHVGPEGKVIELSWYGGKKTTLELGGTFHSQHKRIISSQVSRIPPARQARWDFARRKDVVFQLLQEPAFDQHITHLVAFESAPSLFDQLRVGKIEGLGYCITY